MSPVVTYVALMWAIKAQLINEGPILNLIILAVTLSSAIVKFHVLF